MAASKVYAWWPATRAVEVVENSTRGLITLVLVEVAFAGVLMSPPVVWATGVPAVVGGGIMAAHMVFILTHAYLLVPLARTRAWMYHLLLALDLCFHFALAVTWVVAAGDPKTPLWMGLVMYACALGAAQELEASLAYLIVIIVAPFATVPFFLSAGFSGWTTLGSAILCSALSAMIYNQLATHAAEWRKARAEAAAELAASRARVAELESDRLARDLHDSVGSSLAVVALYAGLVERHADEPAELRRIATALREAAGDGLGDLRSVLDALAPAAATLGALADNLRRTAGRLTGTGGATVDVALGAAGSVVVSGPVRLAFVRVFQEALNNALRHGRAAHVKVALDADEQHAVLSLADDGAGFDSAAVAEGRGLPGMRARAGELGGTCEVAAQPGAGTRVVVKLPLAGATT